MGKEHQTYNGIRIPTKMKVAWKLEPGNFTWYKLEIYGVEYNKPELWN